MLVCRCFWTLLRDTVGLICTIPMPRGSTDSWKAGLVRSLPCSYEAVSLWPFSNCPRRIQAGNQCILLRRRLQSLLRDTLELICTTCARRQP